MVLEKLIVGFNGTNCYLVGSDNTKEIFIIDPGDEPETIITKIEDLNLNPQAIILTHTHIDHIKGLRKVKRYFNLPVWYNQKEYKVFTWMKADKWLLEGALIELDTIKFSILETGGHSPGGISIYTNDITEFRGIKYDGIIFTGDLIFRTTRGRTDVPGSDYKLICSNIRNKIMYNPDLTDNYLILAGHLGLTTIGYEKNHNIFRHQFL